MAQIRHYDKRVGITYVYESESYYDKEKHQSRSKRKLIGKIDPETGEIVPTGKVGRPSNNPSSGLGVDMDYRKLYEQAVRSEKIKDEKIMSLEKQLHESQNEARDLRNRLGRISELCGQC